MLQIHGQSSPGTEPGRATPALETCVIMTTIKGYPGQVTEQGGLDGFEWGLSGPPEPT